MKNDDIDFELDAVLGELGLDDRPSPKKKNERLHAKTSKEKQPSLDSSFQFSDSQLTEPRKKSTNLFDDDTEDFGNYIPSTKRETNTPRRSRFKADLSSANDVQDSNRKKRENLFVFEWDLPDKQKEKEPLKPSTSFKDAQSLSSAVGNAGGLKEKIQEANLDFLQKDINIRSSIKDEKKYGNFKDAQSLSSDIGNASGEKEKTQEVNLDFLQKDINVRSSIKDEKKQKSDVVKKVNADKHEIINFEEILNKFEEKLKTSLDQQLSRSFESSFKKETDEVKLTFENEIRHTNEMLDARFTQERLRINEDQAQTGAHLQSMLSELAHVKEKLNSYQTNASNKPEMNKVDEMMATLNDECNKIKQLVNTTINTIEQEKQNQLKVQTETIEKLTSKMVRVHRQQIDQVTNHITAMLNNSNKQTQVDPAFEQWRRDIEQRLSLEKLLNEEQIKANQKYTAALRYQSNFLAESETSLRQASLIAEQRMLSFESSKRYLNVKQKDFSDEKRSLSRLATEMKRRATQLENMCHTIMRMRDDGIAAVVQLSKEINSVKTIQETQSGSKPVCRPGKMCSACRDILKSTKNDIYFNHYETSKNVSTKQCGITEWWREMANNDRVSLELEDLYLKHLRKL